MPNTFTSYAHIYCDHANTFNTTHRETHTPTHLWALWDPYTCLLHEWARVTAAEHTLLYQIAKVMKHSMCLLPGGSCSQATHWPQAAAPCRIPAAPTEPELPVTHVRHTHVRFVSTPPPKREEVRMRESKDEHVANIHWSWSGVVWCCGWPICSPGSSHVALLIQT